MTEPDRATASPRDAEGPGRTVIVIDASSGIGRACARRFASDGDRVVLVGRSEERLAQAERECERAGASATSALAADVLDAERIRHVVDATVAAFGRVDVVVDSAAVMAYGTVEEVPTEVFERVVDTLVHGTANVARAILPVFRRQGSGTLVIVTSLLASVPVPSMDAYITGKWGQLALARVLQLELRGTPGVHVCTVAPGSVDTPIFRSAANYAGRIGRPPPPVVSAEKVARTVRRLADRPAKRRAVGPANAIIVLGFRLLPPVYDRLVGPLVRLAAFTREAIEPTDGNVFARLPAERD